MKALIKSIAITTTLALLFSINAMAVVNFEDEAYIDDIPFDTEAIFKETVIERSLVEFDVSDEEYINDIPFNTEVIASEKIYELAFTKEFVIEEEEYINDIPFNTEEVCESLNKDKKSETLTCNYKKAINSSLPVELVEIKYLEQNSYTLIRY